MPPEHTSRASDRRTPITIFYYLSTEYSNSWLIWGSCRYHDGPFPRSQKQREAEHAKLQKTIDKLRTEEEPVKPINKKFSSTTDGFEDILKARSSFLLPLFAVISLTLDLLQEQTVGLSSLAEYTLKREQVEEQLQANDVPLKKTKKRKMEVDRGDEEGGDVPMFSASEFRGFYILISFSGRGEEETSH